MSGGPLPGGSADPVREVMAEHRELCERAVDPLEIAAGLEEAGLGQDAAARCRHADLFSLAEELYARVPRRPPPPGPAQPRSGGAAARAALTAAALAALPCAGAAALGPRWPVLLPAAVPLVLLPALTAPAPAEPGPPCAGPGVLGPGPMPRPYPGSRLRPAALGHGLGLAALLLLPPALPGGDHPLAVALVLAAAVSAGSAERTARWYRQLGRGHLGAAGTLAEFRARMRPVLPVALALHLAVLGVLSFAALAVLAVVAPRPGPGHGGGLLHLAAERAGPAQWAAQGVLGLLVVLPVLLARCGRPAAAAAGASAGAAAVLGPLALGRSAPEAWLLGGGTVAAALLAYAGAVLGRAGSHR
ncbi:hypothetical protein DR950_28950 [Kitasatospora xanthocidica]|uniref:Integral membrane protein n=1 Tax=Kitasatospora xanthocidica TaxID=83382 RepID=A0A373A103_9ACTN|nr:hypothetical protein [Kitasatospora xanthocidica]RGD61257.1 hypothetical protein DR950_28950 [Kitasatospora xanthocidica]